MALSEKLERDADRALDLLTRVPRGRCTTYGAVGKALGITPRYVGRIMSVAPDIASGPWHRVVGSDGRIKPGPQRGEQRKRLIEEGFNLNGDRIVDFEQRNMPIL